MSYPAYPQQRSNAPTKIVTVMLLFLTLAVGFLLADRFGRRSTIVTPMTARAVTPRGDLSSDEKTNIEVFQQSSAAVVHITTLAGLRREFPLDVTHPRHGTGSGFVWDSAGHIVTNHHVVRDSEQFLATFANQTTYPAKLVGVAPHKDLAILKVRTPSQDLQPIAIGTSYDLQVGQKVFAIGNPFGLDQTLTTGVISGLGREIRSETDRPILDVIQTDAAINPGNSGGPLLDSAGRLIAVNTAIFSRSGSNDGIGFAIPVDTVRRVVPQLLQHGRVITPDLGIQMAPDNITRNLGFKGILVLRTPPHGAAAKAGILSFRRDKNGRMLYGDLIVAVDGKQVSDSDDLYAILDKHEVGDQVKLSVVRPPNAAPTETFEATVTLDSELY